jgi:orotate phosphoribosyltransferase
MPEPASMLHSQPSSQSSSQLIHNDISSPTSRSELAAAIFSTAHLTGTFLLRSGATSSEYFDKYLFESRPALLAQIARHLAPLVPPDTEVLAGLEMGGIPIATALALHTGLPCAFVRKKPKEYGTRKFAEGAEIQGKRLLIIEDVVTSGGQVIESAADLRTAGALIAPVLCVIDREAGGSEKLREAGLHLTPLVTMTELKRSQAR